MSSSRFRGAPLHCTDPVQPDPSGSRAPPSRWDRCSTPCFLVHAIHFIVLRHDVLQLSFRRFVGVSSNVHHLAHMSETEWSPRRDHRPARTWLRTDVTPRLHLLEGLLDVSNTYDRRLPRTLPAASVWSQSRSSRSHRAQNRLPHGLNVRVSAGQQILVSSDLSSRCLGLIVTHNQRHHLIDH